MVYKSYLILRLVVSVRVFVRLCVRVKNGNRSRMRALPDELSPVTSEVLSSRSQVKVPRVCILGKREKMLLFPATARLSLAMSSTLTQS